MLRPTEIDATRKDDCRAKTGSMKSMIVLGRWLLSGRANYYLAFFNWAVSSHGIALAVVYDSWRDVFGALLDQVCHR